MKAVLLSIFCSLMLATAQIFWKLSLTHHKLTMRVSDILHLGLSWGFLGGAFLYAVATVLWLYLLNKYPLSFIYPMIAFAYVFGAIFAMIFLKEQISVLRWSGVFFVVVGIALIGMNK